MNMAVCHTKDALGIFIWLKPAPASPAVQLIAAKKRIVNLLPAAHLGKV